MITHEIIKVKQIVQVPNYNYSRKVEPNIKNQLELNEFLNDKPPVGTLIRFNTKESNFSTSAISCIVFIETDFNKLRNDPYDGQVETHYLITKFGYSDRAQDCWERWADIQSYIPLTEQEIKEHINDNLSNYFKEAVEAYKTGTKKPRPQRSEVSRKVF